ncbi:MAG: NUDIX domain-containing protein [Veillonellaceae bacterium]|nr:NUDIX domain-containing protein [Veillonellaceae bacterium]
MNIISAGLMMYRLNNGQLEIFLAHPGGPYNKNKDAGYWGIPKGHVEGSESYFEAAIREFTEETGIIPHGDFIPLSWIKQISGKTVYAWAFAGDWNDDQPIKSNTFEIEWPPRSGNLMSFPEIDKAAFFPVDVAEQKIIPAQREFIERLKLHLATR